MLKKDPANMTMHDKIRFSKKIKPGKIAKVAKKLLPKLKKAEAARVKAMKAKNTEEQD